MGRILSSPGGSENHGRVYSTVDDDRRAVERSQRAIMQRSGLNQIPRRRRRSTLEFQNKSDDERACKDAQIPALWGFSIEGGGEGEGLINFPSKFFTASWASQWIVKMFEAMGDKLKVNRVPSLSDIPNTGGADNGKSFSEDFRREGLFDGVKKPDDVKIPDEAKEVDLEKGSTTVSIGPIVSPIRTWDLSLSPEENMWPASVEVQDGYVSIDVKHLTAYPEWSEIGCAQWILFAAGNLFGLALQWGTCGPAIWVMYFSPPVVSSPTPF